MTRGDGSELLGDPVFPIEDPWIPTYLRLTDGRLYWSVWSEIDEAGTRHPLDHLQRGDDRLGPFDPVEEVDDLRSKILRDTLSKGSHPGDTRGMLDAFLRIRSGSDVLSFAQRYGILSLCRHGEPIKNVIGMTCGGSRGVPCRPNGWPDLCWEPVEGWLRFVRHARAMLGIAAALHQGERPSGDDWARLEAWKEPDRRKLVVGRKMATEFDLPYQQHLLAKHIDEWLRMGRVEVVFTWPVSGPVMSLMGTTFGTIALQLMLTSGKSQDLTVCSGCSRPYIRVGRKPQRSRRNYCASCGDVVGSRLRKRDQRSRNSGLPLAGKGVAAAGQM